MRVRHAALLAAPVLLLRFAFPVVARWLLPSRFVRLSEGQASGRHIGKTGRCFSRLTLGGTGVDGAERDEGSWSICMDDANLVDRMRSRECVVRLRGVVFAERLQSAWRLCGAPLPLAECLLTSTAAPSITQLT